MDIQCVRARRKDLHQETRGHIIRPVQQGDSRGGAKLLFNDVKFGGLFFMKKIGLFQHAFTFAAAAALASGCFFLANSSAVANQAPAGINLFQDVESHKAGLNWIVAPGDNYPDEACSVLDTCSSDGSKPKVHVLAMATIDGKHVGRAVYLVKQKDPKNPEAVVFEHQTAGQTYFFRVAPDGSVAKTAMLQRGSSWLLVANSLGAPVFAKDAPDWHADLTKSAAAKAAQ
jgi:hypothetical protein